MTTFTARVWRTLNGVMITGLCLFVLSACTPKKVQIVSDQGHEDRRSQLLEKVSRLQAQPVALLEDPQTLKRYEQFLERHEGADEAIRAPALKRVGDLHMKKTHQRFLDEMGAYEIDPQGPPPTVDYREAIAVYRLLLRDFHDYAENDQVLYALSRAYGESGEGEQALPLLEWLVKEYPQSPYRLEAYFRLGEYYFDRQNYSEAAEAYTYAVSFEDPFFRDKALYKLGWSYFKLKRYPDAIAQFVTVMDEKTADQPEFNPEEGSLVWEAMSYVATSFRHLGGPVVAADFFKARGSRRYEKDLYLMLGNHYMVQGNKDLAVATYSTFLTSHPLDAMAPFFASYIMEAFYRHRDKEGVEASRLALVKDYGLESAWYAQNDEEARIRSRPLIKTELYRLALSMHAKAQKDLNPEDFLAAATWYQQFLDAFPEDKQSQEMAFLLGETWMSLKNNLQAAAAFERSAYGFQHNQPSRKAAYAAIIAYSELKTSRGEQGYVALSQHFAKLFPKDKEVPVILFNAGALLFEKELYQASAELLGELILHHPKHRSIPAAQKLVAHAYMKQGDFKQAYAAYRRTLKRLPNSKKEERAELTALMATALYKEAEAFKAQGEKEEAAVTFLALVRDVPTSELAPEALYLAALLYEDLKVKREAIRIYLKLAKSYKKSELAEKGFIQAALLYEGLDEKLQAASVFRLAAKQTKNLQQAQQFIWHAAELYEGEEQWESAMLTFLSFSNRFPKHEDIPEAFFRMAEARRREGRTKAAGKLYQTVIAKGPKTVFAAKARFQQAEWSFTSFKGIQLKAPLAKSFKKKTAAMKKVVDRYTNAIQSGHLEVVAVSAHRLGEVFEHFQSSLLNADKPKGLTEEQLEEYAFQIEEKAYPFEEKAIKAYESNVKRTQGDLAYYNDWVKKSYARLAELRPSRYRRKERQERPVFQIEPKAFAAMFSVDSGINTPDMTLLGAR